MPHSFESREDYLETILLLSREKNDVHSVEVAERLGFTKASVSRAVSLLRQNGYLNMERDGALTLTESGLALAGKVYEKHQVIAGFLQSLGVSPETAAQDACRIEHVISEESFEKIKAHTDW